MFITDCAGATRNSTSCTGLGASVQAALQEMSAKTIGWSDSPAYGPAHTVTRTATNQATVTMAVPGKRPKAAERVAAELRHQIVTGRLVAATTRHISAATQKQRNALA